MLLPGRPRCPVAFGRSVSVFRFGSGLGQRTFVWFLGVAGVVSEVFQWQKFLEAKEFALKPGFLGIQYF